MPVNRDAAWQQLCEWTATEPLRRHALAVERVMRAAAARYGTGPGDERAFALAGLLHDADYERWPDEHPRRVVAWLEHNGEPDVAHAVSGHFTRWGVTPVSRLDKALIACDELTGFVMACCLVRPDGIASLAPSSVIKKLKDKTFAAKVDRHEVTIGAELLGVDMSAHIQFVIDALRPAAADLGLLGRGHHS